MAKVEVTVCDVCGAETDITSVRLMVTGEGSFAVDLCPEHKGMVDDLRRISEATRRTRRRFEVLPSVEAIPTVD